MMATVDAFASAVEATIERRGLTLTMGGEPTFIPAKPEGAEWNHDAMGPEKLGYARRLTARLVRELYPGAVVMQVFGKQYPGEPLPRWVVLTMSRNDGVPLWRHPKMFALDEGPGAASKRDARELVAAVARELGLKRYVRPCVEEGGSARSPRGWVLPLDRVDDDWVSDSWPFSRHDPVVLTPGISPLGLRLPLGQLDKRHLRRALTVEEMDGEIHLFVPPLSFDDFTALLRIIERVATELETPSFVLCGYPPAAASGVTSLGLAADPGVLELNLPPAATWRDYDRVLDHVTRAAHAEGLRTTRFHLNGQVQGTGGGAHVLFGGPTIERNPFFERPDLLASIIRYWQRHPSLSYFFSGQYVGPGSQAPRADETLMAKLYELETACLGIDEAEAPVDRGFLDRVFHNLLTDSAGNTHLAEISIDKLWNYESPTGLQGLIELRAFETMANPGIQSLCALFARAIVAMLAEQPRRDPLVRHGSRLHDRFMLPAALWEDLGTICADLEAAGLPFDRDWLREIYEARFAVLGRFELDGGSVAIRQALEPWPLMAEVSNGGTTSRMVDNSTDRLEVSLDDAVLLERFRVAVNGVALRFSDVGGTPAVGVRYKAASGWPALHPHVPVQTPLRFDVLDRGDRIVAAAHYHFWNPDGPLYEGRPSGPEEAEARRRARWKPVPGEEGRQAAPREGSYAEESVDTLDLRRQGRSR